MTINKIRIELTLAEKGWTRVELAERCGISAQNVSTILRRGTCEPKTAGKLAAGLGVNVAEIIKEEG
ncbi:helix-turn-helix transcriptional regulator [Oscillospiraceae bacterium 50-16]